MRRDAVPPPKACWMEHLDYVESEKSRCRRAAVDAEPMLSRLAIQALPAGDVRALAASTGRATMPAARTRWSGLSEHARRESVRALAELVIAARASDPVVASGLETMAHELADATGDPDFDAVWRMR